MTYQKRGYHPKRGEYPQYKDRNDLLIAGLQQHKTLQEVGDMYGLTRERVRQIWFMRTGFPLKVMRREVKEIYQMLYPPPPPPTYFCKVCGTELTGSQRVYCGFLCKNKWTSRRRDKIAQVCEWCGKSYYPFETAKYYKQKGSYWFCCKEHQIQYQRNYSQKYYHVRERII